MEVPIRNQYDVKNRMAMLCAYSSVLQHEMESINHLNELYRRFGIAVHLSMTITNIDLLSQQIIDAQRKNKVIMPGDKAFLMLTPVYDLTISTSLPRFMGKIRKTLGSNIGSVISKGRSKSGKRAFVLRLNNVMESDLIDDVIDAVYDATYDFTLSENKEG